MAKQFNKSDVVQFRDKDEQAYHEKENPSPYSVASSTMKDLYNSGLPEDCWEEIVSVQDANGDIFAEMEAEALHKITNHQ